MRRALVLATLFFLTPGAAAQPPASVLHIKIVLVDEAGNPVPVPRHALLISENPTSALPRRAVTGLDGTADIKLRPGNYTIESDRPTAFQGHAYQWTETVDIVSGKDAALELNAGNAEVGPLTAAAVSAAPLDTDAAFFVAQWQDRAVTIWTPTARAAGFVLDPRGLVATTQRLVGTTTSVEVQLSPAVKVAGRVLVADAARDVAIVDINPDVLASMTSAPLPCAQGTGVIAAAQQLLTTRDSDRVVQIADACNVIASAEKKMTGAPPAATHLPVEPQRSFPIDALKDVAKRRAGSLRPYEMKAEDFDVAFFTPVQTYSASATTDFSNWSEYVSDYPAVLMIRATPKLVESFWTTVARGAARTQGMDIPPIKHFKSGFSRMRAFCGATEVTPIHPFKLEQRVSETEAIYEGFYVFGPGALGPDCGTVNLVLYSDKQPDKADTQAVDPKIVQQIWQDFAPYRALKTEGPGL